MAPASFAADGWFTVSYTPLQLAIAPGRAQVFSKATPVYGLRLSLLYGIQSEVTGLDAGLFNDVDLLRGVGVGFCNVARERGVGAQLGVGCNQGEGDFTGLQASSVNLLSGRLAGLQLGFANHADAGTGVQIGVLNHAGSMRGLQLGLLNWNSNGLLPVLPLFNFGR